VSTPDTGPSTGKALARQEARARRRSQDLPDPGAISDVVLTWLGRPDGPQRVTCYASYGTEPDTAALRIALADAGYEVLLPRVVNDHLEWVLDGPETTTSTMGIDEPTGPSVPLAPVRALLIPALAVTLAGDRLGKGGGYYDRVLSTVESSSTVVAAIVHDSDITDEIPCEPHDRRVDWILTPTRAINCSGTLFETPDI
jgi:5-formyltetrahydrofolate cyclo-ligase